MFIDIGEGRKVRVYVKHELAQSGHLFGTSGGRVAKARTSAGIYDPDGVLIGRGYAYCAPGDQFVKRQGTKVALKRALAESGLSKQERTAIWRRVWNLPVKAT
jgi:hypothetical protein